MAIITAGEVGGVTHKCHKRNGEGFVAWQQHSNNILTAVISPAVIAAEKSRAAAVARKWSFRCDKSNSERFKQMIIYSRQSCNLISTGQVAGGGRVPNITYR